MKSNEIVPETPQAAADRLALRLKIVALVCGGGLMGLEMAGVRLLEPYFGSTIYVWGSIIGIFLGSLSLGYWLGGHLADRLPRIELLGGIVLLAAVLSFAIPLLSAPLCRALSNVEGLDPRVRALLGSLTLYALPSICLGMVSPFAVRLAARRITGLGSVAGSLYACSTFGSLLGTFLVSFVLVEWMGSRAIVWSIGAVLVAISVLCFLDRLRGPGGLGAGAGLLLMIPAWFGLDHAEAASHRDALLHPAVEGDRAAHGGLADEHILTRESSYHHVSVIRSYYNHATLREVAPGRAVYYMLFNNQTESGASVSLDDPDARARTACGYTRLLHLGVLFTQQMPRRVLIIGCGGGIGPQAFAHDYAATIERVDVVDIDPLIFELARKYFRYPWKPDIVHSHAEDGRLFIHRSRETWDYIVLDAYTSGGRIPRHLITREFFEEVQGHLTPGGVVVANVISALEGEEGQLFRAAYKTMQAVFGQRGHIYAFPRHRRGVVGENIALVATTSGEPLGSAEIRRRHIRLSADWFQQPGLDRIVADAMVTPPDLADAPLLTDDFCPTDSMVYR